jgi:hypothetical protein
MSIALPLSALSAVLAGRVKTGGRLGNGRSNTNEKGQDIMSDLEGITKRFASVTSAAKAKWNAKADEYNQWDSLSLGEQLELALKEDEKLFDPVVDAHNNLFGIGKHKND